VAIPPAAEMFDWRLFIRFSIMWPSTNQATAPWRNAFWQGKRGRWFKRNF
jgi:hypothetical protein